MGQRFNLVMTVIGFTVSTMFIVFVCTRLIFARIRYIYSRRSFRLSSRSDLSALERGFRGVEPLVLANLPTKKFNDPFFSCTTDARCTVCLSEFRPEDTIRILPFCSHFFHSTCIDIWLQQHCTCPVCRVSLRELSERECGLRQVSGSAAYFPAGPSDNGRIEAVSGGSRSDLHDPEAAENNLILNDGGGSNTRDVASKHGETETPSNA